MININKKSVLKAILCFVALFLFTSLCELVRADTTHTQTVVIQKYALSSSQSQTASVNDDQQLMLNGLPMDTTSGIKPLAGISYQFKSSATGQTWTITTDENGQASIVLADGTYTVTEEANPEAGLTNPEAPVKLTLPYNNQSTVTLYPKSSVDGTGNNPTPPSNKPQESSSTPTPTPINNKTAQKLPKTGATNEASVNLMGLLIVFLGAALVRKRIKEK